MENYIVLGLFSLFTTYRSITPNFGLLSSGGDKHKTMQRINTNKNKNYKSLN